MKHFKLYTALTAALLILIVILQNTTAVQTRILFITVSMPQAALLALTLVVGIALGAALCAYRSHRRR